MLGRELSRASPLHILAAVYIGAPSLGTQCVFLSAQCVEMQGDSFADEAHALLVGVANGKATGQVLNVCSPTRGSLLIDDTVVMLAHDPPLFKFALLTPATRHT